MGPKQLLLFQVREELEEMEIHGYSTLPDFLITSHSYKVGEKLSIA